MLKKIAPIATLLTVLAAPVLAADGDAAKGEKVFKKCKACHMIGEGAKNRTGPILTGVVGDPAGQNPDFKYSKALMEAAEGGLVWDEASISEFLTKPKTFIKGTKMSFPGLKKEADINNLMAYLETFE